MQSVALDVSALDPDFRSHAHRGIGRYVAGLLTALQGRSSEIVSIKPFSHRDVRAIASRSCNLLDHAVSYAPVFKQTLRQQFVQPLKLSALARSFSPRAGLIHFPAHMDAPAFANEATCVTVLDLIPLMLEDLYKAAQPSWRFHFARFLEKRAIQRASLVLCISECTARDTIRLLNIPEEKIFVTPLAVETTSFSSRSPQEISATKDSYAIAQQQNYFLYVGGIDPRKNIPLLVRAHDQLCRRCAEHNEALPLLVLAGKVKEDKQYPELRRIIDSLQYSSTIQELGFVPDADLITLYAGAKAFVFPSLYEGFGFPILEAFAAHCPVICSNNSSLPEVAGNAALPIDPGDVDSIAGAMYQLLKNEELRSKLIALGSKRVPLFSWDKTAATTMNAYERYFSRT